MEKIKDNDLVQVAGGGGIFNAKDISGSDKNNPWEVLDDSGNVKGRYSNRDEAVYNAGKLQTGFNELTWDQVQGMRRR